MRVIAGKAKGARLAAPKGLDVRPTLDRVREALFSILGPRLENAHFLDLFAGSGANGIEALSRGASLCAFVDQDPRSLVAIKRNLDVARLSENARLYRLAIPGGIPVLAKEGLQYEIVFADPPYDLTPDDYDDLLRRLRAAQLLTPGGLLVIEHARRTRLPANTADFHCSRHLEYGDTALSFFS
jgi:16S rRNA (guanine(966)-N(2))-methyltransferase RsmD